MSWAGLDAERVRFPLANLACKVSLGQDSLKAGSLGGLVQNTEESALSEWAVVCGGMVVREVGSSQSAMLHPWHVGWIVAPGNDGKITDGSIYLPCRHLRLGDLTGLGVDG